MNRKSNQTRRLGWQKPVRGGFLNLLVGLSLVWGVSLSLLGCSDNAFESIADDHGQDAQIEDARMALDDTDYNKAVDILEGLDQSDAEVRLYLSNAYAGLGGLDTFSVLETIENVNDDIEQGSIDLVGKVLGEIDQHGVKTAHLTYSGVTEKLDCFSKAIDTLVDVAPQANMPRNLTPAAVDAHVSEMCTALQTLTDDQQVQLGLLSLCRSILNIALIIMDDQGRNDIVLTEKALKMVYMQLSELDVQALLGTDANGESYNRLDMITEDIIRISCSVEAIGRISGIAESNDLAENFEVFLNKLDNRQQDLTITKAELESFLNNL